jgi:hypothetical protein
MPAMEAKRTVGDACSSEERSVLGAASLISILTGAALAWAATQAPAHAPMLERCGGALLVLGLALLGNALPLYR